MITFSVAMEVLLLPLAAVAVAVALVTYDTCSNIYVVVNSVGLYTVSAAMVLQLL